MGARELSITAMPLAGVKGARRNPKGHHVEALKASLRSNGFVAPLVLDERSGRLVVGHGRLEALRALQAAGESPPAGVASADGDWLVPVVRGVRFANPKAAEAYLLADNRLSELGGWDDAELLEVLRDMQGADLLEATGFGSSDITELLRALDPPPRPGADDVPERVAKRTRPGDLWLCGDHRLECVDATQGGAWPDCWTVKPPT